MIILHWTGINSLESTWSYFNRTRAEAARSQLAAAGEVNVSAHLLVDRDGTIFSTDARNVDGPALHWPESGGDWN
jgi:N-acetylmuramoyl-L-alanine amidase